MALMNEERLIPRWIKDELGRKRKRPVKKSKTIARPTRRERLVGLNLYPETNHWRPNTRGDCIDGPRPCPYVGCRYNLYLDANKSGSIQLNFPELEVEEMGESCALDIAEQDGLTLERVGELMNLTRERVRQIETKMLRGLRRMVDKNE